MAFKVGVSGELFDSRGEPTFGREPLELLNKLEWEKLPAGLRTITPAHAEAYDALYLNLARVDASSVATSNLRLKLISRHGVGYDAIDIPAMTKAGVLVANTPDAVRRPVATISLLLILALSHRLFTKDRLTREARWAERTEHMGMGLTGRTLGVVGAGGIGKELLQMARVFDLKLLAADPYVDFATIEGLHARKVTLDELMTQSDFVVVTCLLNDETRKLIGERQLALMKPTSYLINVARGPIVDEAALYKTLSSRNIAGAALDVFEEEPTPASNPILQLDNVIVSPHALAWTDELFSNIARTAIGAVLSVSCGERPRFLVNPDALTHSRVRAWVRSLPDDRG
jgi:phosphoglycerate dehydrogenase-like enzyme